MNPNNSQYIAHNKSRANVRPLESSVYRPHIDPSTISPWPQTQPQPQQFYYQQIPHQYYMKPLSLTSFQKNSPPPKVKFVQETQPDPETGSRARTPNCSGNPNQTIQPQKTMKRKNTVSNKEDNLSTMTTRWRYGFSASMGRYFGRFHKR